MLYRNRHSPARGWSEKLQVKGVSTCTSSVAERRFQREVEKLTRLVFTKIRCNSILSPIGNPLELDMFHSSHQGTVAIEYNGYQHYEFPNRYHKTQAEFDRGRLHDMIKVERCKELDLPLIVIRGQSIGSEMADFEQAWASLTLSIDLTSIQQS